MLMICSNQVKLNVGVLICKRLKSDQEFLLELAYKKNVFVLIFSILPLLKPLSSCSKQLKLGVEDAL